MLDVVLVQAGGPPHFSGVGGEKLVRLNSNCRWIWVLVCALGWGIPALAQLPASQLPSPQLPVDWVDVQGAAIAWPADGRYRVYAFLGCECPVARLYALRLQELAKEFENDSIQWIGVISTSQDSIEDIQRFASEMQIEFPFYRDAHQDVARFFQATRTAEVVVVDRDGNVPYRGRIDDQYAPGVKRARTTQSELRDALLALRDGRPPTIRVTEPVGCAITWEREPDTDAAVTFGSEVAAILYRHCYECHRGGEIGPFDIADVREVRGWAEMILEVIDDGRMPPWHADPRHGSFKNARSMSADEISKVRSWVRAGAPLGELTQIPAPPTASSGWRLDHAPDLVVGMRSTPYQVPASGAVEYQYFVVDPKLTEDRWVSGAQVIPGEPSIVHHAIVFIRPPDGQEFVGTGWLTAYVPGQMATRFPPGYARRIPAGSKFVFQMHYTPNGRESLDLSRVGVTFVDEASVTHEVFTLAGLDQDFEIPPGVAEHRVEAGLNRLPADGELLAVSPHMHLRGKAFELRAHDASGTTVLLSVPRYDFNWQHTYEFSQRIPLAAIDRVDFTATFDNSDNNPFNPDPKEFVMWGDQTWEEMALAFFEVARPRVRQPARSVGFPSSAASAEPFSKPTPSPKAVAYADGFLRAMDRNGDGMVSWDEATQVVRDYSFQRLDRDQDRMITREELVQAVDDRSGR